MKRALVLLSLVFGLKIILVGQSAPPATETEPGAAVQPASQIFEIPTRKGVTESFELITPQTPTAVVVLFTGGDGRVYWKTTPDNKNGNFLLRSRTLFAKQGLVVASFAPPSDRKNLTGFREDLRHVQDIESVIAWLRQKYSLPVWLVGTSNGTLSVAFTAVHASNGPDGIVLTSTILDSPRGWKGEASVPSLALDKISIPVFVVHHKSDGCPGCDPRYLSDLMAKLKNSTRKELWVVSGGSNVGDPCQAAAYHGYNGIEEQVVEKITEWIGTGSVSSPTPAQGS